MSIKIRIPKSGGESGGKTIRGLPRDPVLRAALVAFVVLAVSFTIVFSYFYIKYDRIIEKRFRTPIFANSAKIYSLPRVVRDGEKIDAKQIAAELRRAGYSDKDGDSNLGTYHLVKGGIEITPGAESYHAPEPAQELGAAHLHRAQAPRVRGSLNGPYRVALGPCWSGRPPAPSTNLPRVRA